MKTKSAILVCMLLLPGCIADNESRQTSTPVTENHIHVPPPQITTTETDTNRLVEDTAARVSQNVKTDLAANQAQLSGHVTGQIHKLEATLSDLIRLDAKIDNKMVAELKAELTSTIQLMTALKIHMETQIAFTNEMRMQLGKLSGQLDATVAGQAGVNNTIEKTMSTLQQDIKAGRDSTVNMLPPQAVEVMENSYKMLLGIVASIETIIIAVAGWAYRNARIREENNAKLLMKALSDLEPERTVEIKRAL